MLSHFPPSCSIHCVTCPAPSQGSCWLPTCVPSPPALFCLHSPCPRLPVTLLLSFPCLWDWLILSISIQDEADNILDLPIPLCFRAHNTFHWVCFLWPWTWGRRNCLLYSSSHNLGFCIRWCKMLMNGSFYVRRHPWVLEKLFKVRTVPSKPVWTWRLETVAEEKISTAKVKARLEFVKLAKGFLLKTGGLPVFSKNW